MVLYLYIFLCDMQSGSEYRYDVLSIDIGSQTRVHLRNEVVESERVVFSRPINALLEKIEAFESSLDV